MGARSSVIRMIVQSAIVATGLAASCALAQEYKAVAVPSDSTIDVVPFNIVNLFSTSSSSCASLAYFGVSNGIKITQIAADPNSQTQAICDIYVLHKKSVPITGKGMALYFGSTVVRLTFEKN